MTQQPPQPADPVKQSADPAAILGKRKLKDVSHEEMRAIINGIIRTPRMKQEMYMGVEFFNWMLTHHGVKGVADTVEKIHYILLNEGMLDRYDLENTPAEAGYNHIGYKISRRHFLQTVGWSLPGAGGFVYNVSRMADKGLQSARKFHNRKTAKEPLTEQEKESVFGTIAEALNNYALPPLEALLGAALVVEGHHKWHEIKLDQIANAAAELADLAGLQKIRRPSGRKPKSPPPDQPSSPAR